LGVIETARILSQLAFWTHLQDDADLQTFVAIDSETDSLPVGRGPQVLGSGCSEAKRCGN